MEDVADIESNESISSNNNNSNRNSNGKVTVRETNRSNLVEYSSDDIDVGRRLGKGAFGVVYSAQLKRGEHSLPVAVKVLRTEISVGTARRCTMEEVKKLAQIDHPNVVKLHGIVNESVPWIIMEYMSNGSLLSYVFDNDVREETLIKMCLDVCRGMSYLHSQKLVHRDLAARNILLDPERAKISDLGKAAIVECALGGNGLMYPEGDCSIYHAAKECLSENKFSIETDVWCFGVTMYEMYNGGFVYKGISRNVIRDYILQNGTPLKAAPLKISPEIVGVMREILNPERKERPSFVELCSTFRTLHSRPFPRILPAGDKLENNRGTICSPGNAVGTRTNTQAPRSQQQQQQQQQSNNNGVKWGFLGVFVVAVAAVLGFAVGQRKAKTKPQ